MLKTDKKEKAKEKLLEEEDEKNKKDEFVAKYKLRQFII